MGIYLPKAKMPTTCAICWMFKICPISQKEESAWKIERHPDCPLIEIKEPHGDLIDNDEIHWLRDVNGARTLLDMGNAVIKAER